MSPVIYDLKSVSCL